MNQQQFATYGHPQQQFYAARTNSSLYAQAPGQFATVGRTGSNAMMMSGAMNGGAPIYTWTPPSPAEQQYYDVLFAIADEEKRNAIGGRLAVMFFSRSNADKLLLREIWNIADSQQKGELSRNEFYVAMRLISMAQRGETVNQQRFFELAASPFPLPVLDGVPPPPPAAPTMSMGAAGGSFTGGIPTSSGVNPGAAPPSGSGGPAKGTYAVTDEEKARYDAIFAQYDSDNDGFLLGGEAVNLFQMSGLDRNALREIWALADRGQDSKLDIKEFYVAMHLIVCASKRGLSVPPQLPQELLESAFGSSGSRSGSFTSTSSMGHGDFGATGPGGTSRSGSMQPNVAPPPQEQSSSDSDDPFAGLSPAKDEQPPRLSSFSGVQQQSSISPAAPMAPPDHQGSFHGVNGGFQQQPTPPGSARGSFYGTSVAPPTHEAHAPGQQDPSWGHQPPTPMPGAGFECTNSSSLGPMTGGFLGAPVNEMSNAMGTAQQHPAVGHPSGGMPVAYMQQMQHPKPFLSDEEEVRAVRQLEQQNEEVIATLANMEKKQHAIETLAEKLRELDQLRHELVALTMKRESVRATTAAASSFAATESVNPAELQSKRMIETSLHELIENEKQTLQGLERDLSGLERELQLQQTTATTAGNAFAPSLSMSSSSSGTAPGSQPQDHSSPASSSTFQTMQFTKTSTSSSFSSTAATTTGFDNAFGGFEAAKLAAVDFATPSPANSATSSSGFDSFGAFGASAMASSPSPAASTAASATTMTTTPASDFDTFADFNFN